MSNLLVVENLSKRFTLHMQGGVEIPVLTDVSYAAGAGECVALAGPSGSGKSTFMRMIYGNYTCPDGTIRVCHDNELIDIASADPHTILDIRRRTLGYVSQFLRVVPRVPTVEIVADPLIAAGCDRSEACDKARALLSRLNLPERLWSLSPVTFSGGEQQRVNIARGFIYPYPILLLDEPTASLDLENKGVVLQMISEARDRGTAITGIYHDQEARDAVCTRAFDINSFQATA